MLIDEYQHVPELLDSIKAELNRDLRPGRFILAGSTRYSTLPQAGQALTGRVDIVEVPPLAQCEIDGLANRPLILRLLDGDESPASGGATSLEEYAKRITSGGMPVALRRPAGRSRSRWFSTYLDLVIERDVLEIARIRQREVLPRLLNVLAARSGNVLNIAAAAETAGVEKSTAENYLQLLEAVFLVHRLPAWGTTLGSRVTRLPKLHLVDSGVMAWLLGLNPEKIAQNNPSMLSEYGHLVETFAVNEIFKQAGWWDGPVATGHFRTKDGEEVGLLLERDDGTVLAFEIKTGTRIDSPDLAGIRALRSKIISTVPARSAEMTRSCGVGAIITDRTPHRYPQLSGHVAEMRGMRSNFHSSPATPAMGEPPQPPTTRRIPGQAETDRSRPPSASPIPAVPAWATDHHAHGQHSTNAIEPCQLDGAMVDPAHPGTRTSPRSWPYGHHNRHARRTLAAQPLQRGGDHR